MQNANIKYLRTDHGAFYVFYVEGDTLYYYESQANSQQQHAVPFQVVANAIVGVFSLSHFHDTTYVTYYKNDGNLYVATTTNLVDWSHSLCLLRPQYFGQGKITLIPTDTTCYMLYHTPTETVGVDALFYTEYRDGVWQEGIFFERFIANPTLPYLCHRLGETHVILYYRTSKTAWGSRELLLQQGNRGTALPLLQGNSPCSDISILTTHDKIHMLYSLRSMFRTQIIYQYKQQNTMSPPRILWEGNQCNLCLLFLEGERLTLLWQMNGINLRCISEDGGWSFGSVHRFSEFFPSRCEKGEFVYGTQSMLHAKEIFIDMQRGYVPFLPSHYLRESGGIRRLNAPEMGGVEANTFRNMQESQFENELQNMGNGQFQNWKPSPNPVQNTNGNTNGNANAKTKLPPETPRSDREPKLLAEIAEQKKQNEDLNRLLIQRNEEIATMNAKWRQKVESLERELEKLKERAVHKVNDMAERDDGTGAV
ncbi:MAG: hypothetical protein R3Y53_08325 [Bacillota bacterium]